MATTLRLSPLQTIAIRRHDDEVLEVEAAWAPGAGPPPVHFHPAQDEAFEVLAGSLAADIDGERRLLGPGDRLEVPHGTRHAMWNEGDGEARALWRTSPPGRTRQLFEAMDALQRRAAAGDMPEPGEFMGVLNEYEDVIRIAEES